MNPMANASANPQLSPCVSRALEQKFAIADRDEIANALREFHWKLPSDVDERIHLDIVHTANDLERVRKLVALAKKDWRDLIMATEYEMKDGKLVQTEWSRAMSRKRQDRLDAERPHQSSCRTEPQRE